MTTVRAARQGTPPRAGRDAPRAAPGPETAPWSPRSPVFVGLCSVVLGVPLLVLGEATGAYDDPKAWAFPILVGATALAWLAHSRGPSGLLPLAGDRPGRVLRWLVVAYLAWWTITTATSIAPMQSLLGNFGRGMGLLSVASGVALFFLVQSECRTPASTRALIDAALLGSVPVCLLAAGQAFGWDPLPRAWDPAVARLTVRSTLGQHIVLGSYLAVLVPLAVARLGAALRPEPPRAIEVSVFASLRARLPGALWVAGSVGIVACGARWPWAWWLLGPWGVAGAVALAARPAGEGPGNRLDVAFSGALVGLQALVMVLSRARGPLLGLLVGLAVATFVLLARRRARKALGLSAAAAAVLVLALALINIPRSPLAPLARQTVFSRLGQIANLNRGTPGWFRLQVWRGITSAWAGQLRGREVIPGTSPLVRNVLGYGLETQLLTLSQFALPYLEGVRAHRQEWQAQYLVDRAHNAVLDHLVTAGLVGAGLWFLLAVSLLVVAASRIRTSAAGEETRLRCWALGAIVAHLVEGQVGIESQMPLALFWITAAVVASTPWPSLGGSADGARRARWSHRPGWAVAVVAAALGVLIIAWIETRWLFGSIAYAEGVRQYMAEHTLQAHADFRRSRDLAPWLPLPAEALAFSALRLASRESSSARRLDLLREAEAVLADARTHALGSATSWALTARITFAETRAGERDKLPVSLEAFAAAARLRPRDPALMAEWGWAWLESGEPGRARQAAERALEQSDGNPEWLAWAVLARSAREVGDGEEARRAGDMARTLAPPEARRLLEAFVP
jgi:hypothetical protein